MGPVGQSRESLSPRCLPEHAKALCTNLGHTSSAEVHGHCSVAPGPPWSVLVRPWCCSDRREDSREERLDAVGQWGTCAVPIVLWA